MLFSLVGLGLKKRKSSAVSGKNTASGLCEACTEGEITFHDSENNKFSRKIVAGANGNVAEVFKFSLNQTTDENLCSDTSPITFGNSQYVVCDKKDASTDTAITELKDVSSISVTPGFMVYMVYTYKNSDGGTTCTYLWYGNRRKSSTTGFGEGMWGPVDTYSDVDKYLFEDSLKLWELGKTKSASGARFFVFKHGAPCSLKQGVAESCPCKE